MSHLGQLYFSVAFFSDDDDGDKCDQNKNKGWNVEKESDKEMKG